jgi:hypothetical protein
MLSFIESLKQKNETLFYFGLVCFAFAMICLLLSKLTSTEVFGVSAWIKPFKFSFSTFLFSWAMAWYCAYLPNFNIQLFNWSTIILLGFEIVYIAFQASKGQLSHFNLSTPMYSVLYSMMALAATLVTIYTAYVGILFFTNSFPNLPDGGPGIPLLHWSTKFGDPRVAHFIGMHALQVLPLLSYYLFKNTKAVFIIAIIYFLLSLFTLMQALKGRPFVKSKQIEESVKI